MAWRSRLAVLKITLCNLMLNFIDNFLNRVTMYRLVLYCLVFFLLAAFLLSFFNLLPYTPADLLFSVAIIMVVSWLTNAIFAWVFEAPSNVESVYITALILVFIISPPQSGDYSQFLALALWAAVWAMASKFILAIGKKHIFNPAAFAVALTAFAISQSASWWVGTFYMAPFVAIGGFLVVRKIRRADMVGSFLIIALAVIIGFGLSRGSDSLMSLRRALLDSPILFFAFIMLTEPLTTPPTRMLRMGYGALVGFLFVPTIHIGSIYSTPELALILGNIFSYIASPKEKLILKLKEITKVANDTYDFVFASDRKFAFRPGQYMEWTLAHRGPDSRGNRRYFTIASAPTEEDVRIGVKFYPEPSSFKNKLAYMSPGSTIVASQRAGDFVLPNNNQQKLVFIAGGIGVTPFRSMIQNLLDKNEKRPITLFYSCRTVADIAYKEIFDKAVGELGIKTVYVIAEPEQASNNHSEMRQGLIDKKMIMEEIPDFGERMFYISGPHAMVAAFRRTLRGMGIKRSRIKTDFFPGYA